MKLKVFIFLLFLLNSFLIFTSCEKEQFDEFTGDWKSDYSLYHIKKIDNKYFYTISDLDGDNSVTYENGKYNEDKKYILFENEKWVDQFKYYKNSKTIVLTDIRDEGNLEYNLTKVNKKSEK